MLSGAGGAPYVSAYAAMRHPTGSSRQKAMYRSTRIAGVPEVVELRIV